MGFCCCSKTVNISIHSLGKKVNKLWESEYFCVIARSWEEGAGHRGGGFCCRNMPGTLLNFLLGRVKLMSYSAYRRAKEECGGKGRGEIILVQSLSELSNQKPCQCDLDLSPSQWSRHWLQTWLPWGLAPPGRGGNEGERLCHELSLLSQAGTFSDEPLAAALPSLTQDGGQGWNGEWHRTHGGRRGSGPGHKTWRTEAEKHQLGSPTDVSASTGIPLDREGKGCLQSSLCPWIVGREKLEVDASASLELPSHSLIWRDTLSCSHLPRTRALPKLKLCLVLRCCGIKAEQIITSLAGPEAWRDLEPGVFLVSCTKAWRLCVKSRCCRLSTLSTVILIPCKNGKRGSQTTTRINAALVWQERGLTLVWQTHSSHRAIILVSLQNKQLFAFYLWGSTWRDMITMTAGDVFGSTVILYPQPTLSWVTNARLTSRQRGLTSPFL